MHPLIKLTEDWLITPNGMYGTNWNMPSLYRWESEVLLPWLKEHDVEAGRKYVMDTPWGKDFWSLEKRREQAEWLKKTYINEHLCGPNCFACNNVNKAFGLTEEPKEEKQAVFDAINRYEDKYGENPVEEKQESCEEETKANSSITIYVSADREKGNLKPPIKIEDVVITDLGIYEIKGIRYWIVVKEKTVEEKLNDWRIQHHRGYPTAEDFWKAFIKYAIDTVSLAQRIDKLENKND